MLSTNLIVPSIYKGCLALPVLVPQQSLLTAAHLQYFHPISGFRQRFHRHALWLVADSVLHHVFLNNFFLVLLHHLFTVVLEPVHLFTVLFAPWNPRHVRRIGLHFAPFQQQQHIRIDKVEELDAFFFRKVTVFVEKMVQPSLRVTKLIPQHSRWK